MSDYDPDAILADPNAHPIHKRYAEINIGIRDHGERWAKCLNCGDPYQITEQWQDGTFCSEGCGAETDDYMRSLCRHNCHNDTDPRPTRGAPTLRRTR